jgi:RNA polymerase sigma factor (sigma-70 family)
MEDLISIGTIGLIKAIESFSPDKGTKLATFAARCIENEILMHLRSLKKTRKDDIIAKKELNYQSGENISGLNIKLKNGKLIYIDI